MNAYWSGDSSRASAQFFGGDVRNASKLNAKIASFRHLRPGWHCWHYGYGGPSPESVVAAALQWAAYLSFLGFSDIDAFAGDSGEIELAVILGVDSIDVILEADGTVTIACDRNDKQVSYRSHLSESEALTHITMLARKIWRLSAGYIVIDLTQGKTGLPVWPLETPKTTAGFRSPSANVYMASGTLPALRYANTLGSTTGTLGLSAIPQSFGDSTTQYYRHIR